MKETAEAFQKAIMEAFDGYLKNIGFQKIHHQADKPGFSIIYRYGERYITFQASLDPRDYPFLFSIVFGEGSNEFPDSDWNAITLYSIVKNESPIDFEKCKEIFSIGKDISRSEIVRKVESARELLEQYGKSFLHGDLDQFRKLRAEQNKKREPYRILVPQKDGKRMIQYEKRSSELKEKYSK